MSKVYIHEEQRYMTLGQALAFFRERYGEWYVKEWLAGANTMAVQGTQGVLL